MPTPNNFTRFADVNYIMSAVMSELGIPAPSTFVGSSDLTVQQLLTYLTSTGQDLCMMHDWQMLHKDMTLTLTANVTKYPLPADFNGFISDTLWNNSSNFPAVGPLTPQMWRALKGTLVNGSPIALQYRIVGNQIEFFSGTNATLQAEYYGRGWVQDTTDPTILRDNPHADTDLLLFDQRILVTGLKLRWREGKGFDTTTYVQDFNDAFNAVTGRDTPGPTLSVGSGRLFPFISAANIMGRQIG